MLESTKSKVVVLAVVALGAFAGGRYTKQADVKTVEVEKRIVIEKETQVVNQKVDIEEIKKMVAEMSRKNNIVRERTVVIKPDGTKTETEKETDKTETTTKTETATNTKTETETQTKIWKETVQVVEKEKTVVVKSSPGWSLGLSGGVSLPGLTGGVSGHQFVPGLPEVVVVGVEVDKKLVGPLWVGGFLNSRLDTGVRLMLKF